jgi:hypothetical protein
LAAEETALEGFSDAELEAEMEHEETIPPAPRIDGQALWAPCRGSPVLLHVYDVSHNSHIQGLNALLAHRCSPLKWGGIFHVGVEVYGREWSFGRCTSGSGVCACGPRQHKDHRFRETVPLKRTRLSDAGVAAILEAVRSEYPGQSYHLLHKNCCKFAEDFCQRLGAGPMPAWVHRLACVGNKAALCVEALVEQVGLAALADCCAATTGATKGAERASGGWDEVFKAACQSEREGGLATVDLQHDNSLESEVMFL